MPQSGEEKVPRLVTYRLGPFALFSSMDLPELPRQLNVAGAPGIPVRVVWGTVPSAILDPAFQGEYTSASASEFLVRIPEVGRYYVRNGEEIIIEPYPGAPPLDVRGFLFGNIFAVLCHQRRLLPLHASAVRMGHGVVAFLGASGAGKSTLAGFLTQAGYPLVADDICLLDPGAPVESRVLPVAPWLKLWRGSLEALGHGTDGLAQTFTDEDKFRLPVGRPGSGAAEESKLPVLLDDSLSLRAVVVLERAAGTGVTLTPLKPLQAIGQMMKYTYQSFLLDWLGLRGEHFAHCGKGLEGVQGFTCARSWGFEDLPQVLEVLKAEFE